MKKLFFLSAFLLFIATAAMAQVNEQDHRPEVLVENAHDRMGSGMPSLAVRVRANIAPNPVSTRAVVDAGGAVIRHLAIRDEEGRVVREHPDLNVLRFTVERPGLEAGTHLVDVYTDFGMVTLKMRVQ